MLDQRVMKEGAGWRLGWNPEAPVYKGLVGGDGWAFELTEAELSDFCRLLERLAVTIDSIANELMEEERIACQLESNSLWLEAEGYPHAYEVRLLLSCSRQCEGNWHSHAILPLLEAARTLTVF
ncbi:DUF1818 family protein [Oscillatoria sp. FACHB-1406]|uniref:DUF1818 family protein n=1 Tax=Oscillatoria sp. FACHB-1406 TaxID=2692846 RepID=UPI0016837E49|nr:DUF1818 family protein [Oscillatoria sp. FACHB-1406]MBD2579502.1 DUF1818 family protein [Oscillatoria sp. FACHB-1406]